MLDRLLVEAASRNVRAIAIGGLLALVVGSPLLAHAADGVLEINQASVLVNGGFPITLNTPGSYALTSNLSVGGNADAIAVTADDVYIDLNGFVISGGSACGETPPPAGSGSGVVSSARGTTVVDGTVRGFGEHGISLANEGRVANVRVRCAGGSGIRVGVEGRIEGSTVSQSGVGVEAGSTGLLIDNEITSNTSFGMFLGAGSAIRGNVLAGNNGGNQNAQFHAPEGSFELGPNRCGSSLSCQSGGICGNGVIEAGETCDDGSVSSGDGCTSECSVRPGYECSGQPSVCNETSACGDGVINAGESCDDWNTGSGDGCSSVCSVEAGFQCTGQPSVCEMSSICGDGIVEGFEACDDQNMNSGDGCSPVCTVESGFQCTGQPSVCGPTGG